MVDMSKSTEELKRRLEEAEVRAKGAEEERGEEQQQTQPKMLDEHIAACHSLVFCRPGVGTDCNLASEGPVIAPRDKRDDFLYQQELTLGLLYESFPVGRHLLENRSSLSGQGTRIPKRKISDEKALEDHLYDSVEHLVGTTMSEIKNVEEVKRAFGLGDGTIFENPTHAISDTAEEVVRHGNLSTPPSTPRHTPIDLKQSRAD
ncbi:hypothetical protein K4K54_001996 [Colletotrichum sp. SAR 10_86]|nr:hypothetical protein KHU50_006045 [Colletotrichum sp. SAR 10_65]KAI8213415.1 hypothetical protein K4K52_005115 [Colletotrichum sp. SAR 10_76]KAI8236824.1 hypothetical protein K4K54_001996 [Colletotrichum sp. SAR 10_86]